METLLEVAIKLANLDKTAKLDQLNDGCIEKFAMQSKLLFILINIAGSASLQKAFKLFGMFHGKI